MRLLFLGKVTDRTIRYPSPVEHRRGAHLRPLPGKNGSFGVWSAKPKQYAEGPIASIPATSLHVASSALPTSPRPQPRVT